MPLGYQLGNPLTFFQGIFIGVGALWGLVLLILMLSSLQIVASLLDKTKRLLILRWLLRLGLLVKSTPIAAFSGMLLWASTQPRDPVLASMRGDEISGYWMFFVNAVLWFAFVPSALIFFLSVLWIFERGIRKIKLVAANS